MTVVPLFVCGQCGEPGKPMDLECIDDGAITTITICEECRSKNTKNLDLVRPVFQLMLNIGVPKDIASNTMTHLLDQWPDP